MSADKKAAAAAKRILCYILATLCGLVADALLIPLFAAAMDALSLAPEAAGVLSLITLGAGCTVSGFICGSVKKSRGLRRGFCCAVIMIAVVAAGALISGNLDGASAAAKCITAVICGCTGGVLGVNRVTER